MWKCPGCNEEIVSLNYSVRVTGVEYGSVYLPVENLGNDRSTIFENTEHDETDCDSQEGELSYECSICGQSIGSEEELIWQETEEPVRGETEEPVRGEPVSIESVRTPTNNISNSESERDSSIAVIVCKECKNAIINTAESSSEDNGNYSLECGHCGTENSRKEYKELLKKGYYTN